MDPIIASLERAVAAAPDDPALRLHLAQMLVDGGRGGDAVAHLAVVLGQDSASGEARTLMARALGGTGASATEAPDVREPQPGFDWQQAESDLGSPVPPMFVEGEPSPASPFEVEAAGITLADVGGMTEVKKRLNAAFLAPLRNEKLRTIYRKSLRGGLLLYGPPGCGKTHIARALAGELGARFMAVKISDVLDMYVGNSEQNIHQIFEIARAKAPTVLFFDEVDALGHKRSRLTSDTMRNTVNQLLTDLDGVQSSNDGVFVLAATNAPWDVDPALRRPGRLDRTVLVLPPDMEARAAVWRLHLRERPVAQIDVKRLAKLSEGYTGADIEHACESAAELALMEAAETDDDLRMITQADVEAALAEIRPSIGPWMESARNVALFANSDGEYDELAKFLRRARKM